MLDLVTALRVETRSQYKNKMMILSPFLRFPAKPRVKLTRSISMICVKKWFAADEWMTAVNLIIAFFAASLEWAMQPKAQISVNTGLWSRLIFPWGNHIHSQQHLKAFLELLLSTFNTPTCALINRSTQILPFGWTRSSVGDTKAWQAARNHRSPVQEHRHQISAQFSNREDAQGHLTCYILKLSALKVRI